jgi:hypothetical protein
MAKSIRPFMDSAKSSIGVLINPASDNEGDGFVFVFGVRDLRGVKGGDEVDEVESSSVLCVPSWIWLAVYLLIRKQNGNSSQ